MAKLRRLIQGQDIAFDTHQAGDGQPVNVQALHMEKRLHGRGKIRFPFFGELREPSYEGLSDKDYSRVVREVRDVLRDNENLRARLAETIVSQIQRFAAREANVESARNAARNLANAFDLGEEFVALAVTYADETLASFRTLHPGHRPGTVVEIVQSRESVVIQKPRDSWGFWRRDTP